MLRERAASAVGALPYALSWRFYMTDEAFSKQSKAEGTAAALRAAHERGLRNPHEKALCQAVEVLCAVLADRREDEAVRARAAGTVGFPLMLCMTQETRDAAKTQLRQVLLERDPDHIPPAVFICVARRLVEIYRDKSVLDVLRRRARELRSDAQAVNSMIRDAEKFEE